MSATPVVATDRDREENVARFLRYEHVAYPSPQIALSLDRGSDFRRAAVFDWHPLGGTIETLDVAPGWSLLHCLDRLRNLPGAFQAITLLREGHLSCRVNGQTVDAFVSLPPHADLVQFLLREPLSSTADASATSSSNRPALPAAEVRASCLPAVTMLIAGHSRYTALGAVEGAINRRKGDD